METRLDLAGQKTAFHKDTRAVEGTKHAPVCELFATVVGFEVVRKTAMDCASQHGAEMVETIGR
jgi:hypothetical protein